MTIEASRICTRWFRAACCAVTDQGNISIRGARTHNLKGIDVDLPRGKITAICGVSGSGKSSLAFDTLFAEGQRRYVESLSAHARQFLDKMAKPDVERIDGLSPAIAIDQRPAAPNPRSLIAKMTEIHDYLRVLYATMGAPHDPATGAPLRRLTTPDIRRALMDFPEGTRIVLLAPIEDKHGMDDPGALGGHLKRQGFVRVRVDGTIHEIDDLPADVFRAGSRIEIVVDRIVLKSGVESRLADSIETARRWSAHRVMAVLQRPGAADFAEVVFPTSFTNPETGFVLPEPEPKHFSFNSAHGACNACHGLGMVEDIVCPDCDGARLQAWQRVVTLGHGADALAIHEWCAQTVGMALAWCERLQLDATREIFAGPLLREIRQRLGFLTEVGLGYLTLDRSVAGLSGGEFQRIRLATQIGGGLSGVLYVLDEPSVGLHPVDNARLLKSLEKLRALGNSVVVVEHDADTLRAADHLIEIGPGAGHLGGELLYSGPLDRLVCDSDSAARSLTKAYLTGEKSILPAGKRKCPAAPKSIGSGQDVPGWLILHGARGHNLAGDVFALPLGCLVVVAGVSGSGKSSLVMDTLLPALTNALNRKKQPPMPALPYGKLCGHAQIDKIIAMDQSPVGRSTRSNPATFTGAFASIRALFAKTPAARARGFGPARFSFNRPGGRCEACLGEGKLRMDLHFLADAYVPCESCAGRRFNRETLEVTYKGLDIAGVLELTVDEAADFFGVVSDVAAKLSCLRNAGLGYLRLGQPCDTLSGGEAQRLKLATELARPAAGKTLYLIDEPTTGLHFSDIQILLDNLIALRGQGHTVLVIEHHPDVIRSADWVVELGPGGGPHGGHIIASGAPDVLIEAGTPTGRFL